MNGKKVFHFIVCILFSFVCSGCQSTSKLDDSGAELVWNSAELYGRLGETTDNLRNNNRRIEEGLERLELNNRQLGETSKGLRDAIENYIEFCRLVVRTVGEQDKEIETLKYTVDELNNLLRTHESDTWIPQDKVSD